MAGAEEVCLARDVSHLRKAEESLLVVHDEVVMAEPQQCTPCIQVTWGTRCLSGAQLGSYRP